MWKLHSDRLKYLGFHTSIIQLKACLAEGSPVYSSYVRRHALPPGASGDTGTKGQFNVTCGRLSGLLISPRLWFCLIMDNVKASSYRLTPTCNVWSATDLFCQCSEEWVLIKNTETFCFAAARTRWKWHNWKSIRKGEKAPFVKRFGTSALYAKALPLLSGCRSDKSYSNSPIYYSFLLQNQCLSAVIAIRGRAHQQNCRS